MRLVINATIVFAVVLMTGSLARAQTAITDRDGENYYCHIALSGSQELSVYVDSITRRCKKDNVLQMYIMGAEAVKAARYLAITMCRMDREIRLENTFGFCVYRGATRMPQPFPLR